MDRYGRANVASKKVFRMIMHVVKDDRGLDEC
jgi:hypothetical protein